MGESQAPGGNRRVNTRDPLYRSVVLLPHPALSCGTAKCEGRERGRGGEGGTALSL